MEARHQERERKFARRGLGRRTVPLRGAEPEHLLSLVEGFPDVLPHFNPQKVVLQLFGHQTCFVGTGSHSK